MAVENFGEYPNHQPLVEKLKGFRTLRGLHASEAFRHCRDYLDDLFSTPVYFPCPEARPRLNDFLRLVQWNIEKGKRFDAILRTLREHPRLSTADLIAINEADLGMNRTGHRFVARELGEALQMHVVFAPVYLELTKGFGSELNLPGENIAALQGNAILSRHPLRESRVIELPVCFDHFAFGEKRLGQRHALAVELSINGRRLSVATTHLEPRTDPACRARQVQAILDDLERPGMPEAAILAGDFNTNAMARGGLWRTLRATRRLAFGKVARQQARFACPQVHEPLFDRLAAHGFTPAGFNDALPTCHLLMRELKDASPLPAWLTRAIEARMRRFNSQLDLRLDWVFGRNVRPLVNGEMVDRLSRIASRTPQSINGLMTEDETQVSDHDPIIVDVQL